MSVVRVPPVLRAEAGGAREVEAAGKTVRELLEDLVARVPALGTRVYRAENSALRDPALARCVEAPHQRTGSSFACYPTYDLAIAVCDDLEGVTQGEHHRRARSRSALALREQPSTRAGTPG